MLPVWWIWLGIVFLQNYHFKSELLYEIKMSVYFLDLRYIKVRLYLCFFLIFLFYFFN